MHYIYLLDLVTSCSSSNEKPPHDIGLFLLQLETSMWEVAMIDCIFEKGPVVLSIAMLQYADLFIGIDHIFR